MTGVFRGWETLRAARRVAIVAVIAASAAALWWVRLGRGPEITAVAPTRGTAVEIVYATGAVEPVRWAKVALMIGLMGALAGWALGYALRP